MVTTSKSIFALTVATGLAATVSLSVANAYAQGVPDPAKLETQINEIKAKYEPRIAALKAKGEEATKDLPSNEEMGLGFSVGKVKRFDWYVKIPETVVRQQTWYVRVPEFKIELRRIVWHMPEPCLKYHAFRWGGGMHLPDVCMREKDWRFHVPTVTMREQKWVLGVPEVTMKEQHWIFDFPEITIESSKKRVDQAKEKAEAVGQQGQQLANEMSTEIKVAVRNYLLETRTGVLAQFDPPINMVKALLIAAPDQAKAELHQKLAELETARAEAIKTIEDQLAAAA